MLTILEADGIPIVHCYTGGMATVHVRIIALWLGFLLVSTPLGCTDMIRPSVVDPHQMTGYIFMTYVLNIK